MGLTGSRDGTLLIVAFGQAMSTVGSCRLFLRAGRRMWFKTQLSWSAAVPVTPSFGACVNLNAETFETTYPTLLPNFRN